MYQEKKSEGKVETRNRRAAHIFTVVSHISTTSSSLALASFRRHRLLCTAEEEALYVNLNVDAKTAAVCT